MRQHTDCETLAIFFFFFLTHERVSIGASDFIEFHSDADPFEKHELSHGTMMTQEHCAEYEYRDIGVDGGASHA